ncbi:MAG: hypothetical protein BAA02_05660 [Paenibacillaceae bacterium ZCTH02-B3]|nr:MAG: hypothetical protein BAA02_05660 [Paenibacillaceae bacterium ZCTH02-B3]
MGSSFLRFEDDNLVHFIFRLREKHSKGKDNGKKARRTANGGHARTHRNIRTSSTKCHETK